MTTIRTAKGKMIDMASLAASNSDAVALGNASMNARGDIVDRHGNIVKARETIVREYYATNPNTVQKVSLKSLSDEVMDFSEAAEDFFAPQPVEEKKTKTKRKVVMDDDD